MPIDFVITAPVIEVVVRHVCSKMHEGNTGQNEDKMNGVKCTMVIPCDRCTKADGNHSGG